MANSKYEYVRQYEQPDKLLPNTWIVVRLDGRSFHQFTADHDFAKPNDARALNLMNRSAAACMDAFSDIVLAYGESDEFSFVLKKTTTLFSRRASKLMTSICSMFAASYVFYWNEYMIDEASGQQLPLKYPPQFDGRCVLYPTLQNLKDYIAWRQADCHINNLYNTTFWALVLKGGVSERDAEEQLKGTLAKDKNELLFSKFNINYNHEPAMFRKGTSLYWKRVPVTTVKVGVTSKADPTPIERQVTRMKPSIQTEHIDLIGEEFWTQQEVFQEACDSVGQPKAKRVTKRS